MNATETTVIVNQLERATLELDWAKCGRAKTAGRRYVAARKRVLTALLGRSPTAAEMDNETLGLVEAENQPATKGGQ